MKSNCCTSNRRQNKTSGGSERLSCRVSCLLLARMIPFITGTNWSLLSAIKDFLQTRRSVKHPCPHSRMPSVFMRPGYLIRWSISGNVSWWMRWTTGSGIPSVILPNSRGCSFMISGSTAAGFAISSSGIVQQNWWWNICINHEDEVNRVVLLDHLLQQFRRSARFIYHQPEMERYHLWPGAAGLFRERLCHWKAGRPGVYHQSEIFFQTNTRQAENYTPCQGFCRLTGSEIVYDLYCGTGSIGILWAGLPGKWSGLKW